MNRRPILFAIAAMLATLLQSLPARAADDVLTLVPENAMAVVVVNDLQAAQGKLTQLGEKLQLPIGPMLKNLLAGLSAHDVIDKSAAVAVAVIPDAEHQTPVVVWLVPTTDFSALIKLLEPGDKDNGITPVRVAGRSMVIAQGGAYALLTAASNRATLENVMAPATSVQAGIATLDGWRERQQAYAIAMPAGIKFAQQQLLAGLAIGKQQLAQQGEQAQAAIAGLELYETLFRSLDKEVTHAAIGMQLTDAGDVHLVSRSLLAADGVMAQFASKMKPAEGDLLAGIPGEGIVFAGGGVLPEAMFEPLMKASMQMMKMYPGGEEVSDEQLEKIIALSRESMQGMRSMALSMAVGGENEPLYAGMMFSATVDDADAYMRKYRRTMREMTRIMRDTKSPWGSFTVEPLKIGERDGLHMTMDMGAFTGGAQPPEAEKMMELMFGPGGKMDIFLAPADKHTVLGSYVTKDRLVKALDATDGATGQASADPGVQKTLNMLPDGAQWLAVWNPQGMLHFVSQLVRQIAPQGPKLPDFPATPPIGFAVKLSGDGLETDLVIPVEVLTATAETVRKVRAAAGGPET